MSKMHLRKPWLTEKMINYMSDGKVMIINLIVWIDKKDIVI